jgi:hypothetical protein
VGITDDIADYSIKNSNRYLAAFNNKNDEYYWGNDLISFNLQVIFQCYITTTENKYARI